MLRSKEKVEQEELTPFDGNYESDFDVFVSPKRWRLDQFREPKVIQHENSGDNESNNEYEDEDDVSSEDDEIPVEQFIVPENDLEFEYPNTNINFADSWILIWIFKYQVKFHLSDVTIDSLIKFFR